MSSPARNALARAAAAGGAQHQQSPNRNDFDRAYLSEADDDGEEGVEAEILATGSLARMGLVDDDDDGNYVDDDDDDDMEYDKSGRGGDDSYHVVPDPKSEAVDLSKLRGVASAEKAGQQTNPDNDSDTELENLAELVPDVKARRKSNSEDAIVTPSPEGQMMMNTDSYDMPRASGLPPPSPTKARTPPEKERKPSLNSGNSSSGGGGRRFPAAVNRTESLKVQKSREVDDDSRKQSHHVEPPMPEDYLAEDEASSRRSGSVGDYPDSDLVMEDSGHEVDENKIIPKEFMSSGQSISTATQTHEVRMPMYLPTFKPATGCTNASDFIVRCFVARLRAGITVVKHGRSRWCKSRLRVLHIHPDGRSLSWKPAEGEPASSRRPPKLDLSTCLEVRHAWSPDPQNPMYTGTPILRQKCEAVNAHKSFALIFKSRTVDITAVTADQCKVLMEGFSALCFRLQVANLAGRTGNKKGTGAHARPMPEEDGVSTTASATNTNSSTPRVGPR